MFRETSLLDLPSTVMDFSISLMDFPTSLMDKGVGKSLVIVKGMYVVD
jgi:hypothetical protein